MRPLMGEKLSLALALEGRIEPARPKTQGLIAIAGALANLPSPEIDVTFMKALEQRLLTEVVEERHLSAVPATPADEVVRRAPIIRIPSGRFTIRRGFAAGLAAAALGAFPVAAAAQALPGSPFYGLKTGMEKAQIAFFGGPVQDGFTMMAHAQRRISEAQEVIALDGDAETVASLLTIADDLSREGSNLVLTNTTDAAELRKLAAIAEETEARLLAVAPSFDGENAAEFDAVLSTTESIQQAVASALGGTAPAIEMPKVEDVDESMVTITQPENTSTTHERSGDSDGSGWSNTENKIKEVPDGTGKDLPDPDDGCEIPLQGDGAGDLLAPVAREMCK